MARKDIIASTLLTVSLAVWTTAATAADDASRSGGNFVENASFEKQASPSALPVGWQGDGSVFARDSSTAHSGKTSLRFTNQDPHRYVLCSQGVRLQPGWKCRLSAWVKTRDIIGQGSGATVCLEWHDAQGKWLGGMYPEGVKGTRDWTRVEGVVRIPEKAASFTVSCYVRKGMTGTAWFDDVELVRTSDPVMQSMVLSPPYRGRITADGPQDVRVRLCFNQIDYHFKPSQLTLSYRVLDSSGKNVAAKDGIIVTQAKPRENESVPRWIFDVVVPAQDWPTGKHDLTFRLNGPDGKTLQAARHELVRVGDDFHPKATIDQHRRLLVDGEPFFPLGTYWGHITAEDLDLYAQSKFNCVMPYSSPSRAQMDLAQAHGLKVIYSVKHLYAGTDSGWPDVKSMADEEPQVRRRVREFRNHPALLAWYLNDELPQSFMPRLEAHQRWVAEDDPNHPTWAVLYQYNEVNEYRNTFDVIGTDPYPIGRFPASLAAAWTAETFRQVEGARPMWQVPQLHNWTNYPELVSDPKKCHTPSYDEVRSMAWQCIAEGATGLVFYSWHDMKRNPDVPFQVQWERLKRIAAEIDRLAPVLLSVEDGPTATVRGPDASSSPSWLHLLTRRHGGKIYVIAVNDGDGEGRITIRLPSPCKTVEVVGENRSLAVNGGEFRDESARLAVHVYEVTTP